MVRRMRHSNAFVAGGGAIEMELSKILRDKLNTININGKREIFEAVAKALEIIPRQLCENGDLNTDRILNELIETHKDGEFGRVLRLV